MRQSPPERLVAKAIFYALALFWMLPLAIGAWWYRGGQYVLNFTWMDSLIMAALSFYFLRQLVPVVRKLVGQIQKH
jgi:hypothetical protein